MTNPLPEPKESDNIECHLQQIGMGSLLCRGARQTGKSTTNKVNPTICFNCNAGKIYRDIGCDGVLPQITIYQYVNNFDFCIDSLFCKIRKRDTTFEYCQSCDLVTAETTRQIITNTRGLFQAQGFYSAFSDLETGRKAIRDGNFDNAITRSLSSLESTMRICHEKLNQTQPKNKQISDYWKSTRNILNLDDNDSSGLSTNLLNSLSGLIGHLGSMRNALSDAHGKGNLHQKASEDLAELAINTASTMSTFIIRRFCQFDQGNENTDDS